MAHVLLLLSNQGHLQVQAITKKQQVFFVIMIQNLPKKI